MGKFIKVFLALVVVFISYSLYFDNKILPNVYVGNLPAWGMDRGKLSDFLTLKLSSFENEPLSIFVQDGNSRGEVTVSLRELGVTYDVEQTVDSVYRYGKDRSFLENFVARLKSPFVKTTIAPVYTVNSVAFANTVDTALASHIKPSTNASVQFVPGKGFVAVTDSEGQQYNREALVDLVRTKVENIGTEPILVSFVSTKPDVFTDDVSGALERAKTLVNQKVVLSWDRQSWQIAYDNLSSNLKFTPRGLLGSPLQINGGEKPFVLTSLNYNGLKKTVLDVKLDDSFLEKFVASVAKEVDVNTVDATLKFEDGKISAFTAARDGQNLNQELTKSLVQSKISAQNPSGEKELAINLPVAVTHAKIQNDEINSMGIKELLAKGVSYFAGSIANRAYNVGLGASRINGTLVKPGEVFSFNKSVGEVSGATGYKPAYVISSGRTVLDDGGGICQVSTTVFRAALNAGFPIISRTAHAYRVGYYEQRGYKPGLDATVWAPSVDLSFKNDTSHYILVQTIVDGVNARLEVDIYGTSDGRKVEVGDPVITNIAPAPPDKFQDDPTLPKGTTKQVDFSAPGATSVFTRKVYKGDKLVLDEAIRSVYRPWQAIFLVGTGG